MSRFTTCKCGGSLLKIHEGTPLGCSCKQRTEEELKQFRRQYAEEMGEYGNCNACGKPHEDAYDALYHPNSKDCNGTRKVDPTPEMPERIWADPMRAHRTRPSFPWGFWHTEIETELGDVLYLRSDLAVDREKVRELANWTMRYMELARANNSAVKNIINDLFPEGVD